MKVTVCFTVLHILGWRSAANFCFIKVSIWQNIFALRFPVSASSIQRNVRSCSWKQLYQSSQADKTVTPDILFFTSVSPLSLPPVPFRYLFFPSLSFLPSSFTSVFFFVGKRPSWNPAMRFGRRILSGCHETPHRPHRLRTGPRYRYILIFWVLKQDCFRCTFW